ncbi:hypothetical protein BVG19_g949 [[Candida] boidinii]|nr:hypothetical protein BVG19_g949 [[Candida] boidinii]OWB50586.1 hypothetical protein B5S27_g2137 [[Candida] boidinii]
MAKVEDKKNKGKAGDYEVVSDPRFAKVYSDPRFKAPKRKDLKVKIDDRFSKEELSIKKSTAKVDRFGRKIKNQELDKSDFDKYYEKEDGAEADENDDDGSEEDEDKEVDVDENKENSADEEDEEEKESEEEEELTGDALKMYNKARGITDDIEDSDSDDSSDDDSEQELESEEEDDFEIEEAQAPEGEPSSIFAVVNMDWDHIKAVDLMATFQSFVPTDGKIINISIYPSEYGKERMQREEIEGPLREFFQNKDGSKDGDDKSEEEEDDDDEEEEEEEITNIAEAAKELYEEGEGIDYSSKSLRRYQLQRLRYFYAVVRCDSIETAKNIYESCDGTEYESTSNIFDLRYVPEDMEFEDTPRDFCNKIPVNYKPNDFTTDALQHSKVKFTWDETPADRVHLTNKSFSQKEIEDMDFKAYLASDSEGSEDEEEMKNKYKALSSGLSLGKDSGAPKEDESEGEIDMEITFTPGLAGKVQKQVNEEDEEDESTLSKYQRREKDRRKQRKEKLKQMRKDQEDSKKQEKVENKKKNQNNKNKSKKESEQELKEKANLELLMADENDREDLHYNLKDIMKAEKQLQKQKKNKKSGKGQEIKIDTDIKIDEGDDRFNEIFEDHRFTIDPTNTEFKKTTVMDNLLKSKDNKKGGKKHGKKDKNNNKKRSSSEAGFSGKNSGVKDLADKIKNKQKKRKN